MITLRLATSRDFAEILRRTRALNAQEGIEISDASFEACERSGFVTSPRRIMTRRLD